ncbi:MAG TPA: hypothetical protein DCF33_05420 [Saprospirales bacterium]|nr:hypothetical protein [Saprospirales bacterium]
MQSDLAITHFHSFIIKGVTNLKTDKTGWRIVGIWGDEEKGEGNRIGPTFDEDQLAECEALVDELEKTYGLPVLIKTIIAHFEPPACKGDCGMNYCDENGCTERKRVLTDPIPPDFYHS